MYNLSKFIAIGAFLAMSGNAPKTEIQTSVEHLTPMRVVQAGPMYYRNNNVAITPLDIGAKPYGHEIELKRKSGKIKAKYFATGFVYQKFALWQPHNDVVMVCSGAFTNDYKTPMGITIDNGTLINKLVDTKMDGLVIVYPTGGIAVSNLEDGNLRYGQPEKVANLRSYADLQGFIDWAKKEQATVFQTQLLAYDNELKLDVTKARTNQAQRRVLVIAKNGMGEVLHIVYNITSNEYLGDVASTILRFARYDRGLEVVAMLNLDTGAEDIMEVYNDYGLKVPEPAGPINIMAAINLIAWSYSPY